MKKAIITGISGQDGSYLTEFLLANGYEVHGLIRRSSSLTRPRLDSLQLDCETRQQRLLLHYADLNDTTTIRRLLNRIQPTEFYHLAGQSHVGLSFEIPESTCDLTAMATLQILEILRDMSQPPRFLHASSREIFGTPVVSPQDEQTPVNPNSPYGCAKAFATHLTRVYRESHGLFCCNAICFNHESPRRGENFVTRKDSLGAARIKAGLQNTLLLGDLDSARDWGYAKDYVVAMWMMLQQPHGDDYVLATGVSHHIRELLDIAFGAVGLRWQDHVESDHRFDRPADPVNLCGNPQKAAQILGWQPTLTFQQLISLMVQHDIDHVRATNTGSSALRFENRSR